MSGRTEHEPQGCLGQVNTLARKLPAPARSLLREIKRRVANHLEYPYIAEKSIGDIHFSMIVTSRQERLRVDGRYFESELLEEILNCIQPDDVIFDVGAATGTHTIPSALKTGPEGRVYSFEPDGYCVKVLNENIEQNRLSNVTILKIALWDEDTTLEIHTSGKGGEAAQVTKIGESSLKPIPFKHHLQIEARSMASLVSDGTIRLPNVVKIDVEGGGVHVLKGMGDLRPRDIFIEVHPLFGENYDEIINLLKSRGYELVTERQRQKEIHLHFFYPPNLP